MKHWHLSLIVAIALVHAETTVQSPEPVPKPGPQRPGDRNSQPESGKPLVVEWSEKQFDKALEKYRKQTGRRPTPEKANAEPPTEKMKRRRVQCETYGPQDCAILLGRPAPWGCMVCCRCPLPRPTGQ
jgi:hypothetical protein